MRSLTAKHRTTATTRISFVDQTGQAVSLSGLTAASVGVKETLLASGSPLASWSLGVGMTADSTGLTITISTPQWDVLVPGDYVGDVKLTFGSTVKRSETFVLTVEPSVVP